MSANNDIANNDMLRLLVNVVDSGTLHEASKARDFTLVRTKYGDPLAKDQRTMIARVTKDDLMAAASILEERYRLHRSAADAAETIGQLMDKYDDSCKMALDDLKLVMSEDDRSLPPSCLMIVGIANGMK